MAALWLAYTCVRLKQVLHKRHWLQSGDQIWLNEICQTAAGETALTRCKCSLQSDRSAFRQHMQPAMQSIRSQSHDTRQHCGQGAFLPPRSFWHSWPVQCPSSSSPAGHHTSQHLPCAHVMCHMHIGALSSRQMAILHCASCQSTVHLRPAKL